MIDTMQDGHIQMIGFGHQEMFGMKQLIQMG